MGDAMSHTEPSRLALELELNKLRGRAWKLESALRDLCGGHHDECTCPGCSLVFSRKAKT
jgi:hypothetical protein